MSGKIFAKPTNTILFIGIKKTINIEKTTEEGKEVHHIKVDTAIALGRAIIKVPYEIHKIQGDTRTAITVTKLTFKKPAIVVAYPYKPRKPRRTLYTRWVWDIMDTGSLLGMYVLEPKNPPSPPFKPIVIFVYEPIWTMHPRWYYSSTEIEANPALSPALSGRKCSRKNCLGVVVLRSAPPQIKVIKKGRSGRKRYHCVYDISIFDENIATKENCEEEWG